MSPHTHAASKSSLFAWTRRFCGLCLGLALALSLTGPAGAAILNWKISGRMIPLGDVQDFQISPDSQRVVYLADSDLEGMYELFSVPLLGGDPVKLNGPLVNGGMILSGDYKISKYTGRVVYMANQDEVGKVELYSVPITGGGSTKLNAALAYGWDVTSMAISPDGQTVVYQADQDVNDKEELYSVPIGGGSPAVKLNKTISDEGGIFPDYFISSDSLWVVYKLTQGPTGPMELDSVPIGGGASVMLNTPLVAGRGILNFEITPNGQGVVYISDPETAGKFEVYSRYTNGTGGPPIKLSAVVPAAGQALTFGISPDSSKVVYAADQETNDVIELYSNSIFGGVPHKMSGTMPEGYDVYTFSISPNSLGAAYTLAHLVDSVIVRELYSNYLTGAGGPYKLNPPLVAGGSVYTFAITSNNARVIYRADQEIFGRSELYSAPILGGALPLKLNGPVIPAGSVGAFRMIPNGSGVIYAARQETVDHSELYSNNNLGTIPLKLSGPMADQGNVTYDHIEVSPDSRAVVYIADQDLHDRFELYVSFQGYKVHLPGVFR